MKGRTRTVKRLARTSSAESRTKGRDARTPSADLAPLPRGRGGHYEVEVDDTIKQFARAPKRESARRIRERVVQAFGEKRVPALRTVQKIVLNTRRDLASPWDIANPNTDDEAALVLPVLSAVIEQTEGRVRHVTKTEAAWIATIGVAAPDLLAKHPVMVYLLASSAAGGGDVSSITDFLAFAPWRGLGSAARYARNFVLPPWSGYLAYEEDGIVRYDFARRHGDERRVLVARKDVVELPSGGFGWYSADEEAKK